MDQSHRPGRWVQIFLLVSMTCGVSQICSLAQNATQPEIAASEASTQRASNDTIPDISGVWIEDNTRTSHTYYITAAPDGASHQYHWFRYRNQPPGQVTWLPKQKLFELTGFVNSLSYKVLAQPLADHDRIKFYSSDRTNLDWPSIMARLASPESASEELKEFTETSLQHRGQFGRVESPGLILTETPEGMASYSRALGRWDKIQIPIPKGHSPRLLDFDVNPAFAAAAIDDQLIGYSAARGQWSKKVIPADQIGKVKPVLIGDTPYAQVGDKFYTLSSTTGEWTSPDDPAVKAPPVDLSPRKAIRPTSTESTVAANDFHFSTGMDAIMTGRPVAAAPQVQLKSAEAQEVSQRLASREQSAANLADQVRKQASTLGNDHPTTKSLRAQLGSALSAALDLKFELELLQVKQLQSQLSRLQEQIGQRKAQRQKIIERRINELIENDATNWNSNPTAGTSSESATDAAGQIPSSIASRSNPTSLNVTAPLGTRVRDEKQNTAIARIQIDGPDGTTVTTKSARDGNKQESPLPYLLRSPADSRVGIKFTTSEGQQYQGILEISPIKPHTKFFWDQNSFPLAVTNEELFELTSAQTLTKIVYLNEAGIRDHSVATAATLTSTQSDSQFDPIAAADARGAILLTLRLSLSKEQASSKEQSASRQQKVSFTGPDGLKICGDRWKGHSPSYAIQPLPHTHQVRRSSEMQPEWKFFLPAEKPVFGTLYVTPVKTQTRAYWLSNAAPLTISRDDLAEVARGELVTKVVYLSEDSIRNPQNAIAETLETTGLASENPVEEADRRGAVLAVLHLSQRELSPQVRLTGPQGLSVLQQSNNWRGSLPITREELSTSGSQHAFEFTSQDNQKFYGSLNVSSVKGHTQFFWQTQVPQIEFTQAEIDQLASTGLITKAYYLSENSIRNPSQAHLESVDSLTSPSGTDVVADADVRGAVLAVLKLAPTREQLTPSKASGTNSALSTLNEQKLQLGMVGRNAVGTPAPNSDFSAELGQPITGTPSALSSPNIDAFVRLRNAQAAVKHAKERLEQIENGSPVTDKFLPDAKLELERAQRQQDSVLEELKFSVRDLELQIESFKLETELLVQEQKRMEKLNSAAAATSSQVGTARLKATKSITALERLKLRFEYLKNVIENVKAKPENELKELR